jgi:putative DNA primase/helicase
LNALDDAILRKGGAKAVVRRSLPAHPFGDLDEPIVRRLDYVLASDLPDVDEDFDDELVEGVLGRAVMAVMYGASNSGKTFAAIDLGAAVCRGERWLGKNAVPGIVLYLATEAAGSVRMRLKAYQRLHNVRARGFVIVQSPINLFDGQADVTAVLAIVGEIESLYGEKVVLIIGDTLARIAAGANENSGEDMGVVIDHADAIRAATGATFLWIHHSGKDQARGARGWSGMQAAIDTEIEVTADEALGTRVAEITKQRDLGGKGMRLGFRLESVRLGFNRWGNERTSCVAVSADAPPRIEKAAKGRRPSEIAGAITEFLTSRGTGAAKSALAKHFDGRYLRTSVYREVDKLVVLGQLLESAGVIALAAKPRIEG